MRVLHGFTTSSSDYFASRITLQTVFDQPWQAVVALETDNEYLNQFTTEADAIEYAAGE